MLLHLFSLRAMALAVAEFSSSPLVVGVTTALLGLLVTLPCGFPLHPSDLPWWSEWLRHVSPARAVLARILVDEMSYVPVFNCSKSPVVPENNILVLVSTKNTVPHPLPPITHYWTGLLILDHSYLVGNLTNSKIAETKALESLKS
jgi:hypothetical protein